MNGLLLAVTLNWFYVAVVSSGNSTADLVVSVPILAPNNSQPLVPTLLSFSIEGDRWPDWTGIESRNEFTFNALETLAQLTGQTPKIRVGADSEDHTTWSPTVTVNEDEFPPPSTITPYPEATQITVGDGYYELSKWLPFGTHMTWGINLGLDNATNAVNMAKSIIKAFSSEAVQASGVKLDLIEIGNEADLYGNNGLRPSGWTVEDYVADWISIATPVAQAAGLVQGGTVSIQGAAFAGQGFTPTEIFDLSILNSAPGGFISVISQHRYSAAFCNGGDFPLISFMNKASVRSNLTLFEADIAATKERGLAYVLGETGSIACHGAPGVSNTAGAALWVIDYTLQAATLSIPELYFHEGIGFKYNFIQPIALNRSTIDGSPLNPPQPPQIQPSFYAALLVDTFVGSAGSPEVVELDVPNDNVTGYAAFEQGTLRRAVFVNLEAWLQSSTGERPSVHIDLTFSLSAGGTSAEADALRIGQAQVRRLVIQHADDISGLLWAGQSYETPDVHPSGQVVVETVNLQDGINLNATEAILVTF